MSIKYNYLYLNIETNKQKQKDMKNTTKQQIEIISSQESEKIERMIQRIKDGELSPIHIIGELKQFKKMIDTINRINK